MIPGQASSSCHITGDEAVSPLGIAVPPMPTRKAIGGLASGRVSPWTSCLTVPLSREKVGGHLRCYSARATMSSTLGMLCTSLGLLPTQKLNCPQPRLGCWRSISAQRSSRRLGRPNGHSVTWSIRLPTRLMGAALPDYKLLPPPI